MDMHRQTETLRREVDQQRAALSQTFDHLRHATQRPELAREAAKLAGRGGRGLASAARRKPVPAALAGLGAAWLATSRRPRTARTEEPTALRRDASGEDRRAELHDIIQRARARIDVSEGRTTSTRSSRRMRSIGRRTVGMAKEQPLLFGALGLAFGALLGGGMTRVGRPRHAVE